MKPMQWLLIAILAGFGFSFGVGILNAIGNAAYAANPCNSMTVFEKIHNHCPGI